VEVRFPNGTRVRASGIAGRKDNADWRTFGLYCDPRWAPTWAAEIIDWPDFGVPASAETAAGQIQRAFTRALRGEHVEVGCHGGIGRTGTVLACMAVLAGVPPAGSVAWVRAAYNPYAIETPDQEQWVMWFAAYSRRR
jgi:hypothetical protein